MKLLVAVVDQRDAGHVGEALVEAGYRYTTLGSTGGFLGSTSTTLLIGVEDDEVDSVLAVMRQHCRRRDEAVGMASGDTRMFSHPFADPVTAAVGGANVFILDVERIVSL